MGPDEAERLVQQTLDKYARYVNPGLARLYRFANVLTLEWEASGAIVRDVYGKEYIDCSGGPAVFAVGHRHPAVVAAVREQLDRMPMSVRAMPRRLEADLAEALAEITPGDLQYSFFVNSGAEAVEGALKLARLATGRTEFVAAEGAFHGKTLGALSVSGREVYRAPFQPLLPGVTHVPYGDLDALARAVNERTAAVILEPIQGENGVVVPPDDYLPGARRICDRAGALLILDEVQTGLGRTGAMFACQHWGVVPDILTLAKALGGGVMPIGAFVARPPLWAALERNPYLHSSTFGGNPLACAAALATLRVLREDDLPARAAALGAHLMARLREMAARHPSMIREVRGKGLLVGVEFADPDLVLLVTAEALQRGVIVFYSLNNPSTFRVAPPLVISPAQLDQAVAALEEAVAAVEALVGEATEAKP